MQKEAATVIFPEFFISEILAMNETVNSIPEGNTQGSMIRAARTPLQGTVEAVKWFVLGKMVALDP